MPGNRNDRPGGAVDVPAGELNDSIVTQAPTDRGIAAAPSDFPSVT